MDEELWMCRNQDCDVIIFIAHIENIPRCPNCGMQSVTTAEDGGY